MTSNVIDFPSRSKKKVGRPALGSKARSTTIYVRVTEEEKRELEELAAKNHISMSMYIRLVMGFVLAEGWMFAPENEAQAISSNG